MTGGPGGRGPRLVRSTLVHVALAVTGVLVFVPLYWTLKSSLTTNAEFFATPINWLPNSWHPENFSDGLQSAPFGRYFVNSTIVAFAVTFTTVVSSALTGYGFA